MNQIIKLLKLFIFSWACTMRLIEANAQAPQAFPYQAVARNSSGNILPNQNISIRFSILDGIIIGVPDYQEVHNTTTNSLGQFNVNIGQGTAVSGQFNAINWGNGSKYIQVELDAAGGNTYTVMGTTQLLSVPYALYAHASGGSSSNGAWSLNGNLNTSNADFIGTTDNNPLRIKVNNQSAGEISTTSTSLGYQALPNGNAPNSTAIGNNALNANLSGDYNTSTGNNSLQYNQLGTANTATGYGALNQNLAGNGNTATGSYALFSNTAGYNTATGSEALLNNTSGAYNVAHGYAALQYNTLGHSNTSAGAYSLASNTTGALNTAMGRNALVSNVTGGSNVAIGATAMQNNMSGSNNIAIGHYALNNNTSVSGLVAIGEGALFNAGVGLTASNNGSANTALGYNALFANTNGYENTAVGYESLWSNTTGDGNISMGWKTLYNNTIGNGNTAIGNATLYNNTTGTTNTAVGFSCLGYNTTGGYNVAMGYNALNHNNASGNIGIGVFAFSLNQTGINNTALGTQCDVSMTNFSNSTAIGNTASITTSNQVKLGNNTAGMIIGGFAPWSNYSDGRFKENIKKNIPGLEFIKQLQPVSYTVNTRKLDEHIMQLMPDSIRKKRMQTDETYATANQIRKTGFIAQDVEALANKLGFEFDGVHHPDNVTDHYSIAYSQFIMPLVKGMQEQQEMIETQKSKIEKLEQQMNELKTLLQQTQNESLKK